MDRNESVRSIVAEDIEIVGSIKCESNIQLDGKLNGDLSCSGNAVIGATANVKGNIAADSATILGQVNGNITAKDRIELKASARLNGDIRSKRLTVEDGASFVGKSEVNPSGGGTGRSAGSAEQKSSSGADATKEISEEDGSDIEPRGKGGGIFARK